MVLDLVIAHCLHLGYKYIFENDLTTTKTNWLKLVRNNLLYK